MMARLCERAGADVLTVGDSVGHNLWGNPTQYEVTMDQMVLVCAAVARGAQRAVVSCDMPFGPAQGGVQQGLEAAIRGAATHEADGKISGFTYRADMIDNPIPGRPNTARYVYDTASAYIREIKAGRY